MRAREAIMVNEYAGLGRRLAAFLLDYLVIAGYIILLILTVGGLMAAGLVPRAAAPDPLLYDSIAFVTLVLPVILYFTLLESSPWQATLGKRRVGLRVTAADGGRLSLRQASLRSLVKFLPWQLAHTSLFYIKGWPFAPEPPTPPVVLGLALVWVIVGAYLVALLVDKAHRTPYDRLARSVVVVGASVPRPG